MEWAEFWRAFLQTWILVGSFAIIILLLVALANRGE